MIKNIGKFKQWTGERLGSAKVTLQTEDFQRLEVETDRKRVAFEKVYAATQLMQTQLAKRKPSPEDNFKSKRLPNDMVGVCWTNYGNEFSDDAALGNALVDFGQGQCRLAECQEEFASSMKYNYLDKLEEGMNQFKEYQTMRKKLESRRLDYDAKLTRLQKSKKEKPELEQEMQASKMKYEESEYDVIQKLAQLQEFEDEHCQALYQLLELQTQYFARSLEIVQQVKSNWGRGTPSVVNARQTKMTSISRPETGLSRQQSNTDLSARSTPPIRQASYEESAGYLSARSGPPVRQLSYEESPSHLSPRLSPSVRKSSFSQQESSSYLSVHSPISRRPSSEDTRPPAVPRRQSQSMLKRKALYDFTASSTDELSFKTNDLITVVEPLDQEGWWLGELDGRRGIFPVNYTEMVEPQDSPVPRRIPPPPPTRMKNGCGECGCQEFAANVFKKGHCNNCFHKHE